MWDRSVVAFAINAYLDNPPREKLIKSRRHYDIGEITLFAPHAFLLPFQLAKLRRTQYDRTNDAAV